MKNKMAKKLHTANKRSNRKSMAPVNTHKATDVDPIGIDGFALKQGMPKDIHISGMAVITLNDRGEMEIFSFLPDDEQAPVVEQGCQGQGWAQLMRNGTLTFVTDKNKMCNQK